MEGWHLDGLDGQAQGQHQDLGHLCPRYSIGECMSKSINGQDDNFNVGGDQAYNTKRLSDCIFSAGTHTFHTNRCRSRRQNGEFYGPKTLQNGEV